MASFPTHTVTHSHLNTVSIPKGQAQSRVRAVEGKETLKSRQVRLLGRWCVMLAFRMKGRERLKVGPGTSPEGTWAEVYSPQLGVLSLSPRARVGSGAYRISLFCPAQALEVMPQCSLADPGGHSRVSQFKANTSTTGPSSHPRTPDPELQREHCAGCGGACL